MYLKEYSLLLPVHSSELEVLHRSCHACYKQREEHRHHHLRTHKLQEHSKMFTFEFEFELKYIKKLERALEKVDCKMRNMNHKELRNNQNNVQ
jgi:hypothetical protein